MRKVLVTGASGFIGRHTLKYLTPIFDEVHAIFNRRTANESNEIRWHRGDILDSDTRERIIKEVQPTHLLHLAWYAEPGKYADSLLNIDWLIASLDLIRKFKENHGERAVCAGTCFEYDLKYGYCSEYTTPKVPETIYGVCKNSLQDILQQHSLKTELSSAWGRVFYLYGPHEYPERLVSSVIVSLLKSEDVRCSEGLQKKDFLHVDDVASAFVKLLESTVQGPVNIGSGSPIAVKDLVLKIGKILKNEHRIKLGARPTSEAEPPLVLADNRRLLTEVGWNQKYCIDDGLIDSIEWWKRAL